jgi:hypothetical protein
MKDRRWSAHVPEPTVSVSVRIPGSSEDPPRPASLVAIAVACGALGVALVRWGIASPRNEALIVGSDAPSTELENDPRASGRVDRSDGGSFEAELPVSDGDEPTERAALGGGSFAVATTAAANRGPGQTVAEARTAPERSSNAGEALASGAATAATPSTTGSSDPAAGAERRIVRGRVAYLRCEGVPLRPGPVPCPRDATLEAQAWEAIEALTGCPALPPSPGEADVVIDLAPGRPTEVRTRDTFGSDVVRLDGSRVVECLAGPLSSVRETLGSTRLVVSFRFAVR